jgi:hypothetical protein
MLVDSPATVLQFGRVGHDPFSFHLLSSFRSWKKNERWRRWNQTELLLSHCVCVRTSPGTLPKKQHKIPPKNISQQDGLGTHTDTQHSFFLNLNTTYCLSRHSTSAKLQHYHHRVPFLLRFPSWMVSFLLVFFGRHLIIMDIVVVFGLELDDWDTLFFSLSSHEVSHGHF